MNTKALSLKHLETSIYDLRTHMITIGISKGLTHPDTIKYSQELDILLNKYQKIKSK
ncbi:aspartyl-phosphate phosphatase Spo0E family protein [Peribacillus asahii]|uniref:Aspartyl-phosphate phosphatase Spo0E family protein n=1 Tax=Peribacillus asahii TaxID=228899 RepID=A0A398BI26_9BACI|nr:aspartyl-phosphate phosphatase Spo0E family protein [Peribacillus asahii]RID87073.1 aspartyl-phosphate phosphatase Spo0E family protein [Peribacillus asahii]USK61315.1 aspartyl-phosphate phosphatase Spo0E family protein [Peribacillus asahii]